MHKLMLLIHCQDTSGIIATVTHYLYTKGGNIVYIDQHVDAENGVFFMRLESVFDHQNFNYELFSADFERELGTPYQMDWQMYTAD